jgi:hypothetical protein
MFDEVDFEFGSRLSASCGTDSPLAEYSGVPYFTCLFQMTFLANVERIGRLIADDYARSWPIGAWFVFPFAVAGCTGQSLFGVSFYAALSIALVVATPIAVLRATVLVKPPDTGSLPVAARKATN